jgi:hypothetical protein
MKVDEVLDPVQLRFYGTWAIAAHRHVACDGFNKRGCNTGYGHESFR